MNEEEYNKQFAELMKDVNMQYASINKLKDQLIEDYENRGMATPWEMEEFENRLCNLKLHSKRTRSELMRLNRCFEDLEEQLK